MGPSRLRCSSLDGSLVTRRMGSVLATVLVVFGALGMSSAAALGQNPVPFVNLPLVPDAAAPGGPEFTLTVNGTGFVSGAVVDWNGSPLATQFVSGSQLTATIPAADIAAPRTASVTVVNPAPGGGPSNVAFFSVTVPTASVSFAPAINLPGSNPQAVAVGDLNNNGNLDLAFTNTTANTVSIYLGDGAGNFTLASTVPTGSNPTGVSLADFNNDGNLDLEVANAGDNTTYILLGDGTGSYTLTSTLSNAAGSVAIADFNNDGILDLALQSNSTVALFLGDGTGNFTLVSTTPIGSPWNTFAAGDFNSDGNLDLAVTSWGDGDVTVLLGDGTGHFTSASSIATGGNPPSLVAGDFNNDGKLDLAAVNCGPGDVAILLGDGTGNFSLFSTPSVNDSCSLSVAAGDFNGDSNLDLVASSDSGAVSVLLGDGTGNFSQAATLAAGLTEDQIMVGDFNNDGRLDVVNTNNGSNTVSVFLQLPTSGVGLSPTSLSFAAQLVSTSSGPQTVTLTNTGSSSLGITSIAATGDFAQTNTCGSTVAAGASCAISVTFTPTAAGTRTGTITIADNAAGSPHIVTLTGTRMGPAVSFSASTMSVGGAIVGTTSGARTVTLTNTGNAALTITGTTISPSSFSESSTCGSSLAAGASCAVTVTFTPTTAGETKGMLSIADNAPGSPHEVILTGTGQDFSIGPYNLSQTAPAGVTVPYDLKVAPEGGFSQTVSLACSRAPAQSTCSVTPSSTTLDGRNPAVITLRVATQGAARVPPIDPQSGRPQTLPRGWPATLMLSGLLGALLLMILRARNRAARLRPRIWAVAAALLLLGLAWIACGGGGAYVFTPPTGGTPSGHYVVTVTATSGHLSHALTVQLRVQ